MNSAVITVLVTKVTKHWAKQRKAEERDASRALRRRQAMVPSCRVTSKEAAWAAIPAAYLKASSTGRLPALARQIMYAARGSIQEQTGEPLLDKYFTQTLLPEYLRENPKETADWDVVFDARGHFREPHTGRNVPLGTLNVRAYLAGFGETDSRPIVTIPTLFPTCGPKNRFNAVLFVEKEGFFPIFQKTQLAQRYDIAIMSTKGVSVTAARSLVDQLCGEHGIPLLVLHDFDKAGFSIVGTLGRDTDRYTFHNKIKIIDLGLRLEDVESNQLDSEEFCLKGQVSAGRTQSSEERRHAEEAEFICRGRRVELNAFGSAELITWIEQKLARHGIKKVIPGRDVLSHAYREALQQQHVRARLPDLEAEARAHADAATMPTNLAKQIRAALRADPSLPWDTVLKNLVAKKHGGQNNE